MLSELTSMFVIGIVVFICLLLLAVFAWLRVIVRREVLVECGDEANDIEIAAKTHERLASFGKHSRILLFEAWQVISSECHKGWDYFCEHPEELIFGRREETRHSRADSFKKKLVKEERQLLETKYLSQKQSHIPIDDGDFPTCENGLNLCHASLSLLALYEMGIVESHCALHNHCFVWHSTVKPTTLDEAAEEYKETMCVKEWQKIGEYLERKEAHMPIEAGDFRIIDEDIHLCRPNWNRLLKYETGIVAGHCVGHKFCFLYGHDMNNPLMKEMKEEERKGCNL